VCFIHLRVWQPLEQRTRNQCGFEGSCMKHSSSRNTDMANLNQHELGLTVHRKIKCLLISVFCHHDLMGFCRTRAEVDVWNVRVI
jgi:hypothetical protein